MFKFFQKGFRMYTRTTGFIVFIAMLLFGYFSFANGAIMTSESSSSLITGNGTHIDSFDFGIEKIEYEDILLGSIHTLRKHDNRSFTLSSNNGQLVYTHKGVHVKVAAGNVKLSFSGYAGLLVTFSSVAGNSFEFDPGPFIINTSVKNINDVLVQFDGVEYYIPPGKRTQFVKIDIFPETVSHRLVPDMQGYTLAVIFGSAHLDVSRIDIESLYIEDLAMRVMGKAQNLSTIVRVDEDEYPDLAVMFEDIGSIFYEGVSFAMLKGILSDGTIINGKANILTPP